MSKETTENFWAVWNNFEWPDPKPIFYRLYYNDDGTPKQYSMEDLPGNYIDVDRETFVLNSYNVRVVNQKLVHIAPKTQTQKLRPNIENGKPCHPWDVCVIVDQQTPHTKWKIKHYETD